METRVLVGDCLELMAGMDASSVDTVVTDPPYGLGFMGKDWDHGVPGVHFWQEAIRVARPGAMLLAFGGTRTHHRLMCAIEDAGWEIRDVIMWLYGSGFPKSHDISKAIDKAAGAEREVVGPNRYDGRRTESSGPDNGDSCYGQYGIPNGETAPTTEAAALWDGWGTALKPAWEPVIVAMKPRDGTFANNALKWGAAGIWVDGGRIPTNGERVQLSASEGVPFGCNYEKGTGRKHDDHEGRWPANLILDEEAAALLDEQSGERGGAAPPSQTGSPTTAAAYGQYNHRSDVYHGDNGRASRFFYCAKASRSERNAGLEGMEEHTKVWNGQSQHSSTEMKPVEQRWTTTMQNTHPTVKPLSLMRYLVRLTRTPTGGMVLDPFMGSGTTGMACVLEGRDFMGIEIDADYAEIARRRVEAVQAEVVQPPLWEAR